MKFTNIRISIYLIVMALVGFVACSTVQESTPAAPTPVSPTVTNDLPTPLPTATLTPIITSDWLSDLPSSDLPSPDLPTPLPIATNTPLPTPTVTPIPTSNVVEGWLVYENDFFGYRFSYPPEARIRTQGVTGYPVADRPENMTGEEYLKQLEEEYPDNLCVSVRYNKTSFVTFVPSSEKGGRYTVPCGVTGVGDYDIIDVVETVLIDGESYTASGWKLYERGETATWQGEFYFLKVDDSITIHYGSMRGSQEQFLNAQETLMQIVTSFRSE